MGVRWRSRLRRRTPLGAAALVAIAVGMVACVDLTKPDRVDPPQLRTLSLTDDFASSARDGGLLRIEATVMDTSFRLPQGQRLPLEVAVSSGDHETAGLYRYLCPARERSPHYPCFRFEVLMPKGHQVTEVADRIAAIGGRLRVISPSGRTGEVTLFSPDVAPHAGRAASWPGVQGTSFVSYATGGCLDLCFQVVLPDLYVPMPLNVGAAVPGDGIVQAQPGDTLTVTYQQPGGGTIQATTTVP